MTAWSSPAVTSRLVPSGLSWVLPTTSRRTTDGSVTLGSSAKVAAAPVSLAHRAPCSSEPVGRSRRGRPPKSSRIGSSLTTSAARSTALTSAAKACAMPTHRIHEPEGAAGGAEEPAPEAPARPPSGGVRASSMAPPSSGAPTVELPAAADSTTVPAPTGAMPASPAPSAYGHGRRSAHRAAVARVLRMTMGRIEPPTASATEVRDVSPNAPPGAEERPLAARRYMPPTALKAATTSAGHAPPLTAVASSSASPLKSNCATPSSYRAHTSAEAPCESGSAEVWVWAMSSRPRKPNWNVCAMARAESRSASPPGGAAGSAGGRRPGEAQPWGARRGVQTARTAALRSR
mmetsp:Transcript_18854/g.61620  ORF Transcript_18854/g.61620 Transcript_18854/m.61620 type:complete len:347 (-) Transcript_18854:682-1722(-)|eukprot:scaffold17497_cov96-Isochrysis_galbana.AAC.2